MHKNLPHINLEEYYQFITFRTYDSFDLYAKKIFEQKISTSKKEYELDIYLDSSKNGAYFFEENINILKDIIYENDKSMYEIVIFVIMPNHVHLLLKQLDDLSKIIKFIKGKSAMVFNKKLNKSGKFWHISYFDKVIRNEKHFETVYTYIENNPIKAGLEDKRV